MYTALRLTGPGSRRQRLAVELAHAAERLAAVALASAGGGGIVPPRSRWQRRRALAARGANWIITRTGPTAPGGPTPHADGPSATRDIAQ
nr:hypothetical protein [Streptomyces sp. CBMA152]